MFILGQAYSIDAFSQTNQSLDNFDKAKSSSDEAISLIDSLKGSSLLDSVVEDMKNFSFLTVNQTVNSENDISQSLDNDFNSIAPNNSAINITNISPDKNNMTISYDKLNNGNNITNSNVENMQSMMILPYPMTILSKDYIPLFSSLPLKILNGSIMTKLPCNSTNPLLQIIGASSDNNVFPIHLNLMSNFSSIGNMCMYQSVIPHDLSNLLYSHTLTSIYLYNPLDTPLQVPTTTAIFIGIHKLAE